MRLLLPICLLFISLLSVTKISAQTSSSDIESVYGVAFPVNDGERVKYDAMIQMANGYISGVCVLLCERGVVRGGWFNEFGITALDFTYYPDKCKVKLHHVVPLMDKWYIRRVLRKDLGRLMEALHHGETVYHNNHRNITYQMTPIEHAVTE
ncbi:MAG: hypothetical protein IIT76_12385 [Prevotella sp.]|nr:hypothetical protein [Prevotella sp.]